MTSNRSHGSAGSVLSAVLLAATPRRPAWAHGPDQIVQETPVFIDGIKIVVEYRTTFGAVPARVEPIAADADGDGSLSAAERRALLEGLGSDVLAGLEVTLDGRALGMRCAEGRLFSPPLRGLGDTASIPVRFEGEPGDVQAGAHLLRVADGDSSETVLGRTAFYARAGPRTEGLEVSSDERTLAWTFLHSMEGGGGDAETRT